MIEANIGSPCTVSLLLCSTRPHYIQPWIHKTQCIFQFFIQIISLTLFHH